MLVLLLPGMHGTSRLFDRLMRALPAGLTPRPISYPTDQVLGYDVLLERIELPDEPFAIVAESYSGPIGIRLAARRPPKLRALVLVATFARSPRPLFPRWAATGVLPWLFRIPLSQAVVRQLLVGTDASKDLVVEFVEEQRRCRPDVLAARLRDVLRVDVREDLKQIQVPILYLRGCSDRIVRSHVLHEIKRLRPDIESITLAAPHAVLQRCPAAAAAAIGRFVLGSLRSEISEISDLKSQISQI